MAIRQTISLEGLQTVQQELKNLADVGESAFERIRAAVEGGGGGLEAIATNILNIGKALTSLTGAVTIFAGITGGLVGLTVSASNAGEEFENLGTQLGTTTDTASALISSFARAGADIQGLSGQLRRAAVNISNEFAQIQTSVREAGLKTIANNIAVAQSFNNLAKVNVAAAEQEHNAALQRQADALAVVDAQANLDDLLEKQRIRQGGVRDPQIEADRAAAREEQQIAKARLQLAQAEQKAKEDAALATQRAAEQEIAAQTARLNAAKAAQQATEDQKNSITNLVGFVTDLANGLTNTGRAVNATVDNLFKGIIASAAGLDASLGPIEGDISNIASPTVLNVLFKLSDVLKNMSSETEKTALASKLLGRTVGQEEVTFLSQGSKAIKDHIDAVKALGLEFSTGMVEATQKFRVSLFTLEDTLTRIKDQIGATFAPVFGPFFQVLADLLAQNKQLFVGWAQTLADTVKPTLDSIIRVLSGQTTIDDKWLLDIIETFKNLGRTISEIVVPAFKGLLDVLNEVARGINNIFGTSLDATSIILIAWVAKITGGFKLVGIAIEALGALFVGFAAIVGRSIAAPVVALGALATAITIILAAIGNKEALAAIERIGQGLANLVPEAKGEIEKFFGDLSKGISDLNNNVTEAKTNWELFTKLFDQAITIKFEFPPILKAGPEALTQLFFGPPGSPLRRFLFGESAPTTPSQRAGIENVNVDELQRVGQQAAKTADQVIASERKSTEETKKTTDEMKALEAASRAWGESGLQSGDKTVQGANKATTALKTLEDQAKKSSDAIKFIQAPAPGVQPTAGKAGFVSVDQLGVSAIQAAQRLATPTTGPTQQQAEQQAQTAVKAFQDAADQIQRIWNSLRDAIDAVDFSSIFEGLSDELTGPFLDAEEGIIAIFDAIAQEAERMADRIAQAAQRAAQAIQQLSFSGFGGAAEGAPFASGGRVTGPGSWTSDSIPARLSRDEFVQPAFRVAQYGVDFMEAIRRGLLSTDAVRALMGDFRRFNFGHNHTLINNIINKIVEYSVSQSRNDNAFINNRTSDYSVAQSRNNTNVNQSRNDTSVDNVVNKITDYFASQTHETINNIFNQIINKTSAGHTIRNDRVVNQASDNVNQTIDNITNTFSQSEFIQPVFRVHQYGTDFMEAIRRALISIDKLFRGLHFGVGGPVMGPGSWTSDSIPAWLSRDEFVQPAFRVQQYGVDFMEAIRRGLLSTDMVRMLMGDFRGFKFGGTMSPFPKFAEGGSVGSTNTRILQLVLGGQTFTTTGPAKVIDALEREAALRGIASTGIAQSFVGRR